MTTTRNTCQNCEATIEAEGNRWVDTLSGDMGGTYDYCPASDTGHRKAVAS